MPVDWLHGARKLRFCDDVEQARCDKPWKSGNESGRGRPESGKKAIASGGPNAATYTCDTSDIATATALTSQRSASCPNAVQREQSQGGLSDSAIDCGFNRSMQHTG